MFQYNNNKTAPSKSEIISAKLIYSSRTVVLWNDSMAIGEHWLDYFKQRIIFKLFIKEIAINFPLTPMWSLAKHMSGKSNFQLWLQYFALGLVTVGLAFLSTLYLRVVKNYYTLKIRQFCTFAPSSLNTRMSPFPLFIIFSFQKYEERWKNNLYLKILF